jgi:hypothetical protein
MISDTVHMPMADFPLKWRFTDPKYSVLPSAHLDQVHPLDPRSAKRVWRFVLDSDLHIEVPFRPGFFQHVESTKIAESHGTEEDDRIRKWLYRCAIPFDRKVFLIWQPEWVVETTWKMLVKYWTDFYYPISDDLTVCDESLQWALLFFHEHEIFFGTNVPRTNEEAEQVETRNPYEPPCLHELP